MLLMTPASWHVDVRRCPSRYRTCAIVWGTRRGREGCQGGAGAGTLLVVLPRAAGNSDRLTRRRAVRNGGAALATSSEIHPMIESLRSTISTRLVLAGVLLLQGAGLAAAQPARPAAPRPAAQTGWPLTRPEATGFAETSRYDDVMSFMKAMAAASPQIHLTTYGYTYEGRPLPLAVIGAPGATPEQVLATKKTRIYVQGNIHAGEVEGKEALLWLLRSIAKGERAGWFNSVVLLINPIYNADGNERVSVANRGSQDGPVGGMGQRANAQNLDLNRDCTKLETAEARSLAMLLTHYDPHVAIDLHTTDGSADNGFYLTYETSLNPNDSKATAGLLRQRLLPSVTKSVKAKHGWDYFYYGGVSRGGTERAWRSDARAGQAPLHLDLLRRPEPAGDPRRDLLLRDASRTASRRTTGSSKRRSTTS